MRALGGADLVASNARVPYTLVSLNSVQFANLLSVILPRVLVPADTNPYLGVAVVVLGAVKK
jgi:hypothetical protein